MTLLQISEQFPNNPGNYRHVDGDWISFDSISYGKKPGEFKMWIGTKATIISEKSVIVGKDDFGFTIRQQA